MIITRKILFLILFQVLSSGTDGQRASIIHPSMISALVGSCVEIPCLFTCSNDCLERIIVWYINPQTRNLEIIYHTNDIFLVKNEYRNRTSLLGDRRSSCTLRIDRVTIEDQQSYYPEIVSPFANFRFLQRQNIQSVFLQPKPVLLQVIFKPENFKILELPEMIEGLTYAITCYAEHTCASSPPSIQWNKDGYEVKEHDEFLGDGNWRAISMLLYHSSYMDHEQEIECIAKYHNEQIFIESGKLNIKYKPKEVVVIGADKAIHAGEDVVLICEVFSSNPEVKKYIWLKDTSIVFIHRNKTLHIYDIPVSDSGTYQCEAYNEIGKSSSSPVLITVISASQKSTTIIVYVVSGIICILLLLLIVFYSLRKIRSCKTSKEKITKSEDTKSSNDIYTDLLKRANSEHYEILKPRNNFKVLGKGTHQIETEYENIAQGM